MKRLFVLLVGLSLAVGTTLASAGDCAIHYNRTACKGQEAVSYLKCNGEKECTKSSEAASVAACQELAVKACANDRLDITKSKIITAVFDGKAIKSASGKDDFCIDYAKKSAEFNQCPEDKK